MTGERLSGERRRRLAWIVVLTLALVVRLAWGLSRPIDARSIESLPDQREYLELGRNLLSRGSLEFVDPRFDQTVYAFRMPGYPLMIAACGGNVRVVRGLQASLDTATAVAAGLLTWGIFGSELAAIAATAFVAVNPFLIYFSGLLLSDTLYAAMFTWALLLLQRRIPLAGILLLSLGVLVRPSGMIPAIVLPGVAAVAFDRRLRAAIRPTAIAIALLGLMLTPWAVRNHRLLNHWVLTTTNTGFTLYDGFNDGATGASDQRFVQSMPELQPAGEVGRSALLERRAMAWIEAHPLGSLRLSIAKLVRFWSPVPLSAEFDQAKYAVVGGAYAVVDGLAILGCWRWRKRLPTIALPLAACVVFSAVHAASVGSLRYRMAIEPAVAVLAAGVLVSREDCSARERRSFASSAQ